MNAPLIQPLYDEVQHGTWSLLYRRQRENLEAKGARLYIDALDRMESLTEETIPRVDAMSAELERTTGWVWSSSRD